jgi:hypothetical protein
MNLPLNSRQQYRVCCAVKSRKLNISHEIIRLIDRIAIGTREIAALSETDPCCPLGIEF